MIHLVAKSCTDPRRARVSRPPGGKGRLVGWPLRGLTCALLAATALSRGDPPRPDPSGSGEYRVKAAFLFRFCGYVKWPEEAFEDERSPFVLLVVGEDPFGQVLERTLHGRRIGRRAVEVRRTRSLAELPAAHLLFLADSHADRLDRVLERFSGSSTLVVADRAGLAARGATLGFYLSQHKVRFEVNLDAAGRARLTISSQLLKLARIVHDKETWDRPR